MKTYNILCALSMANHFLLLHIQLVLSLDSKVDSTLEVHKKLMARLCDVVAYHDLVVTTNQSSDHGVDISELGTLLTLLQRNAEDSCKAVSKVELSSIHIT